MVLIHQIQEPVEKLLALLLGHTVDVAHVPTDGEDALPACDGVRPDDRVDGSKDLPNVLRGTARLVVKLEAVTLSCGGKAGLVKGDR